MDTTGDAETGAEVLEAWVREELRLPAEAVVRVTERPGTDPRCSPVVTEVSIASPGDEPYSIHIEHALAGLGRMDLVAAMAFGGGH